MQGPHEFDLYLPEFDEQNVIAQLRCEQTKLGELGLVDQLDDGSGSEDLTPLWQFEVGGFHFRGEWFRCPPQQLRVLKHFVDHSRQMTFSMKDLHGVWPADSVVGDEAVRQCLTGLRKVLGKVAVNQGISVSDPIPNKSGTWSFELPRA